MAIQIDEHLARLRKFLAQGRVREAEVAARAVLAINPDVAEAHGLLGQLAARGDDIGVALHHLERAPDSGDVAAARGIMLVRAGRYEEAIEPLTDAAARSSDPLGALLRLAWVEERLGHFDRLDAILAHARDIAAHRGQDITVNEAILLARTDRWRAALATLDTAGSIDGENRIARGRLRDRAGRQAEAWEDFSAGKAEIARHQNIIYPAASIDAHFAQLRRVFTADRFAGLPRAARRDGDARPVFVAGAPRSGTTLVERLITAGGDIMARGELPFADALTQACVAKSGSYPDGIETLNIAETPAFVAGLRDDYLTRLGALSPVSGDGMFVDKMPFNEQFMPLLRLAFPDAPFVVMTRHPLDVILSMMSHHMTHGYGCAVAAQSIAHHLVAIDQLTAHWEAIGCSFYRLRYEDLVSDPNSAMTALGHAIGIVIRPGTGRISSAAAATPSYAQVLEPVNDSAVGRWHAYAPQLRAVIPVLAGYAERHGYDLGETA